jgi:transposase
LKVMAFDEARFGLINWHRRRYCPEGFRPPRIVRRRYEWSWLYAAVEPKSGESFCSYMSHVDGECLEAFLRELGEAYPDDHLVVVMDNAPSHRSGAIALPENMSLLKLPSYSPELNPVERWFLEFRRSLSNRMFASVEALQQALTRVLEPYWAEPAILKRLTGYSWWVEAVESL